MNRLYMFTNEKMNNYEGFKPSKLISGNSGGTTGTGG